MADGCSEHFRLASCTQVPGGLADVQLMEVTALDYRTQHFMSLPLECCL